MNADTKELVQWLRDFDIILNFYRFIDLP